MKKWTIAFLVMVLLLSGCQLAREQEPMVHITYYADEPMSSGEMAHTAARLEQRMEAIGIVGYTIRQNFENSVILLDVPRSYYPGNLDKLATEWGSQGVLSICIDEDGGDPPIPPEGEVLKNSHVASAEAVVLEGEEYAVTLKFTEEGAEILSNTTKRLTPINGSMAIWMDHQIISTPSVVAPITEGEAVVTGFASWESAALFAAKAPGILMPLHCSVDFSDVE